MFAKLICGLLVFGNLMGNAAASVIFDQSPGANSNYLGVSSTINLFGGSPGYRRADDFSLASSQQISDVHWWGRSSAGGDSFTFTFYADGGGAPGTALLSTTGTLVKSTVDVGAPWGSISYYSSDLSVAFDAIAGTTYWLSIFNDAADASWTWLSANASGNGSTIQTVGDTTWSNGAPNFAYQLTNTVPEPGALSLISLSLMGLAAIRRRKW